MLLITLNRPERLNAVDAALTQELGSALEILEQSADLRVGVLTGAGKAFCAGLDMKAVAAGEPVESTRDARWGFAGMTSRVLSKPLIAAVNGDAIGGGLEIALACDVIVAAEGARIGLPEVAHGLFAAGGGVHRLAQQLPEKVALEMLLTGRLVGINEAASWGLVHSVVSVSEVVADALALAERIAGNAPLAVRTTKRLTALSRGHTATDAHVIALTNAAAAEVFASKDVERGLSAFRDGRRPEFVGD